MPFGSAEQQLSIVIKAKDDASATLAKVNDNVNKMGGSFTTAVKASTIFAASLAGVGVAAAAFGYKAVQAAADAEAQMAKFGATLDTMGPKGLAARDAILQASKAAVRLGFDDEAAANSIANLFQRTGDLNQALKLNGLAMDLARAKGIDLAEAQKLISLVMSGNQRALKLYGIEISDTLTPMQALAELQKKVAGQSEAFAGTFQGQMAAFHEQWQNFLEIIGARLLPLLTELLKGINPIIEKLGQWADNTALLVGWLQKHQTVLIIVAGAITGALVPALIAFATTLWVSVLPALAAVALALAPWIIGGALIAGVVAGIMWIVHNWEFLKAKATEIWNTIVGTIKDAFAAIGDYVMGKIQGIIDLYNKMVALISKPVNAVVNFAGSNVSGSGSAPAFANPNANWFTGGGGSHEMGGTVPGPVGMPVPIMAHGQERVIPAGSSQGSMGNVSIVINNPVVRSESDLDALRRQLEDVMRPLMLNAKVAYA